jgi:putative ABC transport system permease protein
MEGYMAMMTEEQIIEQFSKYVSLKETDATYETNLDLLCAADLKVPKQINIYPKDFASKEAIEEVISDYNDEMKEKDKEDRMITYTDIVGVLMSAVTDIIDIISYVLIAFVSISLVVSSIMIGIITYISVLERTKEIGILRSIGASKKDISRVFNAETLIVGFTAGAIGIGVTLLINIPANMIIKNLTGIDNISKLPTVGGIALVIISMFLTVIAGLVPSRYAAKKDPVVALRSE